MIYAKLDDASALQRLDAALCEATKPKWYQRLLIIKLSATEHMSVPKLAKMFNLCDDSVRSYIHKYNTSGLEALMPKSPPGCRGKITHFSNPTGIGFLSKRRINTKNFRPTLGNGRLNLSVLISKRITGFLSHPQFT